MGTQRALWKVDMLVVFKHLVWKKCSPLKEGSSSRFTILCPVAIGLVIRMNKHYIHTGLLRGLVFFFFF